MDCLFIEPNTSGLYQELAKDYQCIETPTWSLLLAQALRSKYEVGILDCNALRLSDDAALQKVLDIKPRLVCAVVYSSNPNGGTTNLSAMMRLCNKIKENSNIKIALVGSHASALPLETLAYKAFDYVLIGDGRYALEELLERKDLKEDIDKIGGMGYKDDFGFPKFNDNGRIVQNMDQDLPGYAWDLLLEQDNLNRYRCHNWLAKYDNNKRQPYATIYSSLGCNFSCSFCMINSVNRTSLSQKDATESRGMRFWSPEHMIKIIEELVEKYGIYNLRYSDEMFLLNKKYYEPLVDLIIERGLNLNSWVYSRIDTVNPRLLDKLKKAGINFLALGVEAGNKDIRKEITKGSFKDMDIVKTMDMVKNHGLYRAANYIFGFPNESLADLQNTLDLAIEINAEFTNMYTCTNLPGSKLYNEAVQNGWKPPQNLEAYAFLGYDYEPLDTGKLTGKEVLKFRDEAWHKFFEGERFLSMIQKEFGPETRKNIEEQAKIKLKRKALGD